jgi:hypothetical protein
MAEIFNKFIRIGTLNSVNDILNEHGTLNFIIDKAIEYKKEHDILEAYNEEICELNAQYEYHDDPDWYEARKSEIEDKYCIYS